MFKLKIADKVKKQEILKNLNLYESIDYKYVLTDREEECEVDKINIVYKQPDLENLFDLVKDIILGEGHYIHVEVNGVLKRVNVRKILYFQAAESEVDVVMKNEIAKTVEKLYVLEEELKASNFIRISKSNIVNISKIDFIKPIAYYKLQIAMVNGDQLEVTRKYRKKFESLLNI